MTKLTNPQNSSWFRTVTIDGVSVEWNCWFDASDTFRGWLPKDGSALGEGVSLVYLRMGPKGCADNGWYLEGPGLSRDFLDPQPPPFSATLEAATRLALSKKRP